MSNERLILLKRRVQDAFIAAKKSGHLDCIFILIDLVEILNLYEARIVELEKKLKPNNGVSYELLED